MANQIKQTKNKLARNDQLKLQQAISSVQAGNYESAKTLCTKLLRKHPSHAEVLCLLGVINFKLMNLDVAAELMSKAAKIDSGNPHYYCELARIEKSRGHPELTLNNYLVALKKPLSISVYIEIGTFCYHYGQIAVAADCFNEALKIRPNDPSLMSNLAKCHFDLLHIDEAKALYLTNLKSKPEDWVSVSNLATILRINNEVDTGLTLFENALHLSPINLELKIAYAQYLSSTKHFNEGEELYREVLSVDPFHQEATLQLIPLLLKDRFKEALFIIDTFINELPANAYGYWFKAKLMSISGKTELSEEYFNQALAISPNNVRILSDRSFLSNYLPSTQIKIMSEYHMEAAATLMRSLFCRPFAFPNSEPDVSRRLIIAYISPDLHNHSVSFFLEPLLRAHDRTQVHVIIYSDSTTRDDVNIRLRELADDWYDIAGVSCNGLREKIAYDRVDILIELAGYTGHNRLELMAMEAAPVQVSYLGYPNHIALPMIKYRISDEIADPVTESRQDWHQTLYRLPGGFLCYQPADNSPDVNPAPLSKNGYVTFGSFNTREKLSMQTLQLWAKILNEIPSSRLLIKSKHFSDHDLRQLFIQQCEQQGIPPNKLQLMGHLVDSESHLAAYHDVDIALDPMPYNGTTTTCEALWMGVPVITLSGDRHASRVGSSLLHRIGLGSLVANNEADYLHIAVKLAGDHNQLQRLRATMRERMLASPLMDENRIGREMEDAYREMWRDYCSQ